MFTQLGLWITGFLQGYVARVVGQLARELVPITLTWLTVYVGLYGYAMARGEASESLSVFFWKMIKISFILSFALGAATYMSVVFSTADGLQDGMATLFISGGPYGNSAPGTVFSELDNVNDQADRMLKQLWGDASIMRLDLVVASCIFALGTVLFQAIGTIVVILSKVLLAFVLAIGPMTILTLMFKQTARFFDAWLSTLLSAVVLSWFVFFALGLSFYVVQQMLDTMSAAGAFSGDGVVNAIEAAATYLTFMVVLSYLLYHAPQYAAALTGGAAVQHGGQLLGSYLGSRAGSRGGGQSAAGGGGGGGGSIRSGGGGAYQAGRFAGAATAAATRSVSAAYQRVAHRGTRS